MNKSKLLLSLVVVATLSGCGAGKLATEYPLSSKAYTVFTASNGHRYMAARNKTPGKFVIGLPQDEQFKAGLAMGLTLPPKSYFRAGADEYVKTFGPTCRVTNFEVIMLPAYEATYVCDKS